MTREVSRDLAKLCGLAAAASIGATYAVSPMIGVGVSVGMLSLVAIALISPAGPTVLFDNPAETAETEVYDG